MEKGKMEEGKMYFGNWGDGGVLTKEVDLDVYAVRIIIDDKEMLLTNEQIESIGINYLKGDVGVLEIRLNGDA